jgi:hypothetical protein
MAVHPFPAPAACGAPPYRALGSASERQPASPRRPDRKRRGSMCGTGRKEASTLTAAIHQSSLEIPVASAMHGFAMKTPSAGNALAKAAEYVRSRSSAWVVCNISGRSAAIRVLPGCYTFIANAYNAGCLCASMSWQRSDPPRHRHRVAARASRKEAKRVGDYSRGTVPV